MKDERNILVDASNSEQGFLYFLDGIFNGSIGPIDLATGDDIFPLLRTVNDSEIELSNMTHGPMTYLCLQTLDVATDTTLPPLYTNTSLVHVIYTDWLNRPHFLGRFSTLEYTKQFILNKIVNIPILDPKQLNFGNIEIAAISGGPAGTTATYYINLTYSFVYLSPDADKYAHWRHNVSDSLDNLDRQFKQIMDSPELLEVN